MKNRKLLEEFLASSHRIDQVISDFSKFIPLKDEADDYNLSELMDLKQVSFHVQEALLHLSKAFDSAYILKARLDEEQFQDTKDL